MSKGAVRGAIAGVGSLVLLEAAVQVKGAEAVGGLLGAAAGIVRRCLDPTVPALPDHSQKASNTPTLGADGQPNGGQLTPGGQYLPPTDSTQKQPNPVPLHNESYSVPYLAPVTRNA